MSTNRPPGPWLSTTPYPKAASSSALIEKIPQAHGARRRGAVVAALRVQLPQAPHRRQHFGVAPQRTEIHTSLSCTAKSVQTGHQCVFSVVACAPMRPVTRVHPAADSC
jgi:hypothetical protein